MVDDAEKPEIVLIETLWNVKELAEKLSRLSAIFLIETLWNVKSIRTSWFKTFTRF